VGKTDKSSLQKERKKRECERERGSWIWTFFITVFTKDTTQKKNIIGKNRTVQLQKLCKKQTQSKEDPPMIYTN